MTLRPIQWKLVALFAAGNAAGTLAGGLLVYSVAAGVGALRGLGISGVIQSSVAYVLVAFFAGLVYLVIVSPPIAYFMSQPRAIRAFAALVIAAGPGLVLLWFDMRAFGFPVIVHGLVALVALVLLKVGEASNPSFKRTPDGAA
jgi:hypothetical protein